MYKSLVDRIDSFNYLGVIEDWALLTDLKVRKTVLEEILGSS